MHQIIEDLNWRYATKKFDPTQKLSNSTKEIIEESLRLVPTSYGLQAMKFLWVESSEIREQLKDAAYGQSPVVDASHLLVMCAYKDITNDDIDSYLNLTASTREVAPETLGGYSDFLKQTLNAMPLDNKMVWNAKQVYIALGQLLQTCANLRVDALPMEGFNKTEFDRILNLEEQNLASVVICPIGYRHEEDAAQLKRKVRKSKIDLFETK